MSVPRTLSDEAVQLRLTETVFETEIRGEVTMKGLVLILSGGLLFMTACNNSNNNRRGLRGDIFPEQLKNASFMCNGTDINTQRQYSLTASVTNISSRQVNNNDGIRYMQSSLIDGGNNINGSVSQFGNFNQGVGQTNPAEAVYNMREARMTLAPNNQNGTVSTWDGRMEIWTNQNRGSFRGRLNGMNVNIPNLNCQRTNGVLGNGMIGGFGVMPSFLTCTGNQYTATINNGTTMTLSRGASGISNITGGSQQTYTLMNNSFAGAGSTQQTYTVSQGGTVTVSQGNTIGNGFQNRNNGIWSNSNRNNGQWQMSINNVRFQGINVNEFSMFCR